MDKELIRYEMTLEYTMLQVEEFSSNIYNSIMTESGDERDVATPAQRKSFKEKIKAMVDSFKEWIKKLVEKIKAKLLTKNIDKEIEEAKTNAKLLDENDGGQCEIPDHTEEYKDIEYTRYQLKKIESKLKSGKPVSEDEVRGIMEEYRKRRIAHCHGGKKKGNYGWGVNGVVSNIYNIGKTLGNNAVGVAAVVNNANVAMGAFNLAVGAETLRAGILLSKEEAELKTKDLSECVKFIHELNKRGQKVHPELIENLVKTPRGKIDRFFTD